MSKATQQFIGPASPVQTAKERFPDVYDMWRGLWPVMVSENNIENAFAALVERYAEPHRFYHTMTHIQDLITQFRVHETRLASDARPVLLAIFYHDVIYNAEPGTDETASVKTMYADLIAHRLIIDNDVLRAADLIGYTTKHDAPGNDRNAHLFLDMDMSILAAAPECYAQYADNVLKEFTHTKYEHDEFCAGRIAFLQSTLSQGGSIFKSPEYATLEERARRNMNDEIARLHQRKASFDQPTHAP